MNTKQLLKFYGSRNKICEKLGLTVTALNMWFHKDEIPRGRQFEIQVRTKGELKADRKFTVKPKRKENPQ